MKNRTTILLVCLLIALAQGGVINWGGKWDLKPADPKEGCYPAGTFLITQKVGTITVSWIWDNSKACIDAKLAGENFLKAFETTQNGVIDLQITDIEAKLSIDADNHDTVQFKSKNGLADYGRRPQMVNWDGTWDIITKDENLCNPDGAIVLEKYSSTTVRAKWTWAKSKACVDAKLEGNFAEYLPISGNAAVIKIKAGGATIEGIFALIRDQAVFANANGVATATFVKRQELVNWVGTWNIQSKSSTDACYPDGYITITSDKTFNNLEASWVWGTGDKCKDYGLAGKPFSQSQPVPQGNAIFLDFSAGGAFVSGIFSCSDERNCKFDSVLGASASFTRRDQMVSWVGVFDIVSKDATICSPDGSITIDQTTDQTTKTDKLSISWTWAKTDACKKLGLSEKFNQVVDIPKTGGNSISLDIKSSTPAKGLLTVFLDGAVFSSDNTGSSTLIRRQENVSFVGTWDIQTKASEAYCYPNKNITITQAGGTVTAKWTWEESVACKAGGLNGKEFSQSTPSPKGRAIFLDIVLPSTTTTITRISGLFSVSGVKGTFSSFNGASATFTRVSGGPSEGGSWGTIIIVLLIIVALGVAGYLYVQNRNKKLLSADLNTSLSEAYTRT